MTDILLTDMTCAQPSDAWIADNSYGPIPGKPSGGWRILDYRCKEYAGRMLTTCQADAAVVRIPLGLNGWHAVSIGIGCGYEGVLDVRLTGDKHWQRLPVKSSREEPWIMADLTGRDLEIKSPEDLLRSRHAIGPVAVASLMSLRAMPMPEEHVQRIQGDTRRPLVYLNDGHGIFFAPQVGREVIEQAREVIERALTPFADGGWAVCCFGCGGADLVNYPSALGTMLGHEGWDFPRKAEAIAAKLEEPMRGGWDPLKQAVDLAHAQGQELWMYLRPQGWMGNWPYDHSFRSRFYGEHLACRCVEAEGQPIAQLSVAYDAVREQLNGIAAEALDRGADGICIALVRGYPLVRYEEPVCARFRQVHGDDARQRPDTDPELRLVWREFIERWFGELRALLDGGQTAAGKRRKLAVICGANLEWNQRFGVDVADFARKRLLDAVLPYPYGLDRFYGAREYHPIDIAEYVRALRSTGIPLFPSLGYWGDHQLGLGEYRRRAHGFYQAGADGLCRWDTDFHLARVRLDSPAQTALWCEVYQPHDRELTFLDIGGIPQGPFPPVVAL